MKTMKLMFAWMLVLLFFGGSIAFAAGYPSFAPKKLPIKSTAQPLKSTRTQLKLTFQQFSTNGRRGISRSLGEQFKAAFKVENLGQTTESVRVYYMVGRNPTTFKSNLLNLSPGQVSYAIIDMSLPNSSQRVDRNFVVSRNDGYISWYPTFALRKANATPFSDANMADNVVGASRSFYVPIAPPVELEVVSIDAVRLTETWHGGGRIEEGTIHPVSLAATVTVKNHGWKTSRPARVDVTAAGKNIARAKSLDGKRTDEQRVGRCRSWPGCAMSASVNIPALNSNQSVTLPVNYAPIPHVISRRKHNKGGKFALGPYICGRGTGRNAEVYAGTASFTAHISGSGEDRAFGKNNTLIKEGTFDTTPFGPATVSCGLVRDNRQVRTYRP